MNLGRTDLNLLRVFDAVFEERNLLRAGKRLHLTQSAVSHALGRLRMALRDELFVRTGQGLQPTARAVAMSGPLREALRQIEDTLGVMPFDPQRSARQFVIAANDYVTAVLVSRLDRHFRTAAPGIDLVIRPSTRLDLAEQIDVGRIDLAIGIFAEVPNRFQSTSVLQQEEVLVMRKGHPIGRRVVALKDLGDYPLLTVSVGGQEEGAVSGFILERGLARQSEMFDRRALKDALARTGVVPRFRTTVPHALAIPALLRESDMISIVPSPLAQQFARTNDVIVKALPYRTSRPTLRALWHRRNERDPAHEWLRSQVTMVAAELRGVDKPRNGNQPALRRSANAVRGA